MTFNFSKVELHDVILFIGVIGSIFGAAVAYSNNTSKVELAIHEMQTIKEDVSENRKVNFEQSLLLREISVNVQNLAETIKDMKTQSKKENYR